MELYFSPLACSLASRIVAYEADLPLTFIEVDPRTQRTETGDDFTSLHALGLVPLLRDGALTLFESVAILPYLARKAPAAGLLPDDAPSQALLAQWLAFIATELHKVVYVPLLDPSASDEVKAYARAKAPARLARLAQHLAGRAFVLDGYSIADAYLTTILNWSEATAVDLKPWPAVAAYLARQRARPSFVRALAEELPRYQAKQASRRERR